MSGFTAAAREDHNALSVSAASTYAVISVNTVFCARQSAKFG